MSTLAARWDRLPQRRREALLVLACLPAVTVAGAVSASLSSRYGMTKFAWFAAGGVAAMFSISSLRISLPVLLAALSFPFRTKLLLDVDVHTASFIVLIVIGQLLLGIREHTLGVPRTVAVGATLVLFGALVGALAGSDTENALFRTLVALAPAVLVLCAVAAGIDLARDLRVLVLVLAACLAGSALLTLYQASGGALPTATFEAGRANGLFDHPNILGGYLTTCVVVLLGVASIGWRRLNVAPLGLAVAILLGVAGLAFTQSRGALLALAGGVVVVIALTLWRRQFASFLVLALVIALALVVAIPEVPESQRLLFAQRVQKLFQPGAEEGRSLIYKTAETVIAQNPITGVGPLGFSQYYKNSPLLGQFGGHGTHAHNIFLEGYLSLGLIGFLGFLLLVGAAIRRLLRVCAPRSSVDDDLAVGWAVGLLGAFTAVVIQGMVDFVYWQIELLTLLFFLIGLAFALDRAMPPGAQLDAKAADPTSTGAADPRRAARAG